MTNDSITSRAPASVAGDSLPTLTLVGVGGFGASHLRAIRIMEEEGRARLANVVDPHPERLPEIFSALKAKGIPWYKSWEQLEENSAISDCVSLAVPIPLHLDYAKKAYCSGAYVYLEKPPVPLLQQIDELIAMEGDDRRIQVGFAFPYSLPMQRLKACLQERKLGEILSYRLTACWPRDDRYYERAAWAGKLWDGTNPVFDGPATNALAHRIYDLLDLESVVAGHLAAPERLWAELYRARPIESYDVCCARGFFPSGAEFSLALSHASITPGDLLLEVIGSKGKATINNLELEITGQFPSERLLTDGEAFYAAYRDFLQTAKESRPPRIGLVETRSYVATTNAMFLSSGEIHPITSEYCRKIRGDAGAVYHVDGLNEYSMEAFLHGKTFSELGVPWGVAGSEVVLRDSCAGDLIGKYSPSARASKAEHLDQASAGAVLAA